MKKIFITGIAGFLGSHVADEFINQGYEVAGNDNLIGGYEDNVPKDAVFYPFDCRSEQIKKILEEFKPDILIHTAATAYEGLSVFSPSFVTSNIFEASISVFSAAISSGVQRIINCSSMARYGAIKVPFTEDMSPKPQDPYGIAKYAAEQTLECLAKVHSIEYVTLVPHNIIGPRQKYDDPYRNVASIMINRCLQGLPPIIYGDGTQTRCFSFIQDVLNCLMTACLDEAPLGQVINVGPDEEVITINELSQKICELTEFKGEPMFLPARPQEVKHAVCSSQKARKLLDYGTKVNLKDGLQSMVTYIKNRGVSRFNRHMPVEIISDLTPKTWISDRMNH
tara:strand:+ start:544 stop:1557 length:1014 start_codon:yes stop_codon:yes gene_type:complete